MNDSNVPAQSPSRPNLLPAYAGIAVALALTATVALIQWVFAPQFTLTLDWTQTAVGIYFVGVGTLGCLLILPALVADGVRTE